MLTEPDEEEMLAIKRTLNVQRNTKADQREKIFHSRCTIQGKVCSLIIDSGSCSNVASTTPIKKLGLQTLVHRHRYYIQWLNQGKGLQVNSKCLVSFSIGKNYFDEVWCDICVSCFGGETLVVS